MKLLKKGIIISFVLSVIFLLILSYTLMLTSPKYALKITNLRGIEWNSNLLGTGKIWNRSPFEFSDINIRFALYENSGKIKYETIHIDQLLPNTVQSFGPIIGNTAYATHKVPIKVIEKEASGRPSLNNWRIRFSLIFILLIVSILVTVFLLLYYSWYENYSIEYGLRLIDKPTILSDNISGKEHIRNILTGTLKNFSRREFSDISLKFILYIEPDEQIGTFEVHVDNLQPNKIYKISQPLPSKYQDVEHALCQLVKITAT